MILLCPLCNNYLTKNDKNNFYKCTNNHCYDIAKEGYTNLLLANQKHSLYPGDNKEMVNARKEFLNKDYFLPLSNKINDILIDYCNNKNITILDAGCGTGYYLNNLQKKFNNCSYFGVDISKFAVMKASKENKNISYFTANIFNLPFSNNSIDIILNIFAPKPEKEFRRILKNNGIILEVTPSTNHMIELKKVLYDNYYFNEKNNNLKEFNLVKKINVNYTKILPIIDIEYLLKMTPYFYKTKKEDFNKIYTLDNQNNCITFDFDIKIYKL